MSSSDPVPVGTITAEWEILRSLLRGNGHHSFPNTQKIRTSMLQAEADLKCYDEQIQRLHMQIISLENKRKLVERNALGYRSLLAPIRKLPPEILQQIFLYVCDRNYLGEETRIPPATLVQVCGMWHEVVQSSPCLWSTIDFQVLEYNPHSATAWTEQLERLLEHSRSAPLSITASITVEEVFGVDDPPFQCVNILALHSQRWFKASIDVHYDLLDVMLNALRPIQDHLPLLEHLEFDAFFQTTGQVDLFHNAPKLRSARLRDETRPNYIALPWNQLQSLVLCNPSCRYPLISLSSQLRDLTIHGFENWHDIEEEANGPSAPLISDIKAFSLGLEYESHITILSHLNFPKLSSFSIFSEYREPSPSVSLIASFFSRSSCTITSLEWSSFVTDVGPFISFLATIPSLTSLSITEGTYQPVNQLISNELLKKLHIQFSFSSIAIFLPNLQTLSLSSPRKEISGALFIDALKSRWLLGEHGESLVKSLRAVTLKIPPATTCFSEAGITSLQRLVQAGMKIVVRDSSGVILC